ncbi:hypothetical protein F4803DRAFT_507137 [Xylaria telfairii]|nr:hypothetical protein F4803DRAFT_507137 [Xylaria telfairii]
MTMSAIKLRQVKEDPSREDIFKILHNQLAAENTVSLSEAVTRFTQSVKKLDEDFFWGFWENIFSVAEQIPHSHHSQDTLVAFVRELTLVPETGEKIWEARAWTDLPLLGAAVREHLSRELAVDERVSFHAFVARLLHAGISPGSETTAIWMLRDSLEGDGGDVDRDLMTAAVYIEYAGATLAQKLDLRPEPQLDEAQQRMLKGGALWKGQSGLTVERWKFWGERFGKLAEKATRREARDLALHAARLIEVWTQTLLST